MNFVQKICYISKMLLKTAVKHRWEHCCKNISCEILEDAQKCLLFNLMMLTKIDINFKDSAGVLVYPEV